MAATRMRARVLVPATALALAALTAAGATAQVAQQRSTEVPEMLRERGIVGYADRLSVQPGETIRFMVSSEEPEYRADIVRLIHGDANPNGPGFKETLIETPVSGDYAGRRQELPFGSYVLVPDSPALRLGGSFTVTAWIAPTTPGTSFGERAAQGVVTKWSAGVAGGYGVFIDEEGRLSLRLGGADGATETLRAETPLRAWRSAIPGAARPRPHGVPTAWYFVAVSYDAGTGRVVFVQRPQTRFPGDATRAAVERTAAVRGAGPNELPLLMAAHWSGSGAAREADGHYNGKIDNPRIYDRALDAAEIDALEQGEGPDDALADWDFAADIESDVVSDRSPRGLHGRTVNAPTRAVTGHTWNATVMDFKQARDQYGAIYFHDDDLVDAGWDAGFELRVPDDLASGVYAARLRTADHEDYAPFFVRPRRGHYDGPHRLPRPDVQLSRLRPHRPGGRGPAQPLLHPRRRQRHHLLVGPAPDHQHAAEDHHPQPLAVHGRHAPDRLVRRQGLRGRHHHRPRPAPRGPVAGRAVQRRSSPGRIRSTRRPRCSTRWRRTCPGADA